MRTKAVEAPPPAINPRDLLARLKSSPRALLLRELVPAWNSRDIDRTQTALAELQAGGLVKFSAVTDRYYYTGPRA